jgi:ABC-2 type transport system permease protein
MKSASITAYKLKEMTRDIRDLLVPLIFPVIFILVFGFALGGVEGADGEPYFNYLTPGMVVFALLLLTVGVSGSVVREVEKGTLSRLELSLMSSFDLLFGVLLAWGLIAAAQVVIMFGVAILIGFEWTGGWVNMLFALLIGIISGIASVALGLIIAAFSKSEGQSGAMSSLIAVPMAFLVGVFIPLRTEMIAKFLPWGQATNSLRTLLNNDGRIIDVLPDVGIMAIETVVVFLIGVVLFAKMRLKPE